MKAPGVELSIAIVNWNGGVLLQRSVESVIANPPSVEYEVVVVDNASTDESVRLLGGSAAVRALAGRHRLRVIENTENRGFGGGNNQAFAATAAPLIFLLNPDAEVTSGCLDRLIATLRPDARIGAVGPRLLNADGSLQVSVWRNPPAAWEILLSQMKLYRLLPRRMRGELLLGGHWDHGRERAVPMLSGAALLVRREVVSGIGGFDGRFHMYAEDNEWCLRMVRAGWRLMFQPAAVVRHQHAYSSSQRWTRLDKLRVQLDATYVFQRHALPRRRLIRNQLASYATASMQLFARRVRGLDAPEIALARRMYWRHFRRSIRERRQSR